VGSAAAKRFCREFVFVSWRTDARSLFAYEGPAESTDLALPETADTMPGKDHPRIIDETKSE
jgi:hypothetical protein